MQHNNNNIILPIEKIISVLSYITMGIAGLIWIIIAYICKRHIKYFLMYNITQSMVIAILLAIFNLIMSIIMPILSLVPFLNFISAMLNYVLSIKIIRIYSLGLSFSFFEFVIFILLIYIIIGVCLGRIFNVPLLTKLINKVMKSYN